jgi:DeoR/GlpR family transcriptional regulator of sugar metabolism
MREPAESSPAGGRPPGASPTAASGPAGRAEPRSSTDLGSAASTDWVSRYAAKVRTAEAAITAVASGEHIFIGSGAAEPQELVAALEQRAEPVFGTESVHIRAAGLAP